MNDKIILESLASDLKRVALGLHRGSNTMAKRFAQEAVRRSLEIDQSQHGGYINKILNSINQTSIDADTALMYSTLIQNYSLRRYSSTSS